MAKTGETAAHLGPAARRGATSRLRRAAGRMVRRRDAPQARLSVRKGPAAAARRLVDGERLRLTR